MKVTADMLYIVDVPLLFFLLGKICLYVRAHNYIFQKKLLFYYRLHALLSDSFYLQNTLGDLHFESSSSVDVLYVVLLKFPSDLMMYKSLNFTACLFNVLNIGSVALIFLSLLLFYFRVKDFAFLKKSLLKNVNYIHAKMYMLCSNSSKEMTIDILQK